MNTLDVLFFTFIVKDLDNQTDSNMNVGYAKLGASDRKALSKVDNWEVFSTICQNTSRC